MKALIFLLFIFVFSFCGSNENREVIHLKKRIIRSELLRRNIKDIINENRGDNPLFIFKGNEKFDRTHFGEMSKVGSIVEFQKNTFMLKLEPTIEFPQELFDKFSIIDQYLPSDKSFIDFSAENEVDPIFSGDYNFFLLHKDTIGNIKSYFPNLKGIKNIELLNSAKEGIITIDSNHHEVIETFKNYGNLIWIERKKESEFMNYGANTIVQGKAINPSTYTFYLNEKGLTGKNQIIGCADTGVDVYNCLFSDASTSVQYDTTMSTHRKLVYYQTLANSNDVKNGHGTHVLGSIVGSVDSSSSTSEFNGVAPEAKAFFQDVGSDDGSFTSIPNDLNNLFSPAYANGAKVHSNSWGCSYSSIFSCSYDCKCYFTEACQNGCLINGIIYMNGDEVPSDVCLYSFGIPSGRCCEYCNQYGTQDKQVDSFTYQNDDFLVLFAAGNLGMTSSKGSISSPSLSKNALSVGASQNTFDSFQSAVEYHDYNYYMSYFNTLCGTNFQTQDESCAFTGNSACPSSVKFYVCKTYRSAAITQSQGYYNENNIASFSSRGPTYYGRIKPDVVFPGESIISANSMGSSTTLHCNLTPDPDTSTVTVKSGTSMATPIGAGISLLVKQYFSDGYYPTGSPVEQDKMVDISGTLIKTFLIHSAIPSNGILMSGDYSIIDLSKQSSPNIYEGFGKVQVQNYLKFDDSADDYYLQVEDRISIVENEVQKFRFIKNDSNVNQFKVTISWYENEGSILSSPVNDNLDLSVTINRRGTYENYEMTFWGNNVEGGDELNNVERVTIDEIYYGDVIDVKIEAKTVLDSNMKYSLVISSYGISKNCTNELFNSDCTTCSNDNSPSLDCLEKASSNNIWIPIAVSVGFVFAAIGIIVLIAVILIIVFFVLRNNSRNANFSVESELQTTK